MSSTAIDLPKVDQRPGTSKRDAARDSSSGDSASAEKKQNNKAPAEPADEKQALKRQRGDQERCKVISIMKNLIPFALVGLAYFAMKVPAVLQKPRFHWGTTKYVYAFGDSYTFVQGTAGHPNFSFIGDAFDLAFSPDQLLSNEIVPRYTSSDGSNWIEFLTGCVEGRPSDCTPHQLWDFAFAGADIDPRILPLHHNFTVDLIDEVKQWAAFASDVVPHPPESTLTAWWIGINDTGDSFRNSSITDWTMFWHSEMRSYFNAVEFAHGKGLRGTYLFINVPPGHRAPARQNDPEGQALLHKQVQEFNTILSGYIEGFAIRHRHMNVLTFDAYSWFSDVLDNASQYGFTNTTGFCQCSDPSFFWYDNGHPTERVHKMLAEAIEAHLLAASA